MLRCFSLGVLAILLSGCGSTKGYPSLERRAVETAVTAPAPPRAPKPVTDSESVSPALIADLDRWTHDAQVAHRAFTAKLPNTERLMAAVGDAALGSEAWSSAAIALGDLESARSKTMLALAELDQIYIADRLAHAVDGLGNGALIGAAHDAVEAMVGQEDAKVAELKRLLHT